MKRNRWKHRKRQAFSRHRGKKWAKDFGNRKFRRRERDGKLKAGCPMRLRDVKSSWGHWY